MTETKLETVVVMWQVVGINFDPPFVIAEDVDERKMREEYAYQTKYGRYPDAQLHKVTTITTIRREPV